jgi:antitoxin CcdA
MLDAPSTRKSVNLSIEAELLEEAKTLGIDLSRAAGVGVSDAIRRRKGELWLEENREAIEQTNAYFEENGLPFAEYRGL